MIHRAFILKICACLTRKLYTMSVSDNSQPPIHNGTSAIPKQDQETPKEDQEAVHTTAQAKRKPRQPKEPQETKNIRKEIAKSLGHTEYVDDQNALTPQPDDLSHEPSLLDLNNETTPLRL